MATTARTDGHTLGRLGALLLDAGTSVTDVRTLLMATLPPEERERTTVSVLPADIIVGDAETGQATITKATQEDLSLVQSAHAQRFVQHVADVETSPDDVREGIARIRARRMAHADARWIVGDALVSAGLAILFRCPWWAVLLALIVGALIGLATTWIRRLPGSVAILPFLVAFLSTLLVGGTALWLGISEVPLFAVCAPIALLVPGAMITNSLIELTSVDMVTGTARLAYGTIMLAFMAAGIAAGIALTDLHINGDSASRVSESIGLMSPGSGWEQLPPTWFAWIGVIILAAGVGVSFGANGGLTAITVVMMLVTYGLLIAGGMLFGDIVAAGLTAGILFLAARIIERTTRLAPAVSFFQPAFLLLVPGTVGLVALTSMQGPAVFSALGTFVSLCIGTKAGSVIADITRARPDRYARE